MVAIQPAVRATGPFKAAEALVSVVTPSYNSGEFIEQTIHSVLSQTYSNIEYIVVDGGSTDATSSIVDRYRSRLRYVQEADSGAAQAINRGIKLANGSIVAWLSADDLYFPEAVTHAVRCFEDNPGAGIVYGDGIWIDREGRTIGKYPTVPFDKEALQRECILCQPSVFIRTSVWEKVGGLREFLQSAYDYDLWIRCREETYLYIQEPLAMSRMHGTNKSLGAKGKVFEESMHLQREHFGYVHPQWIYGYASYRKDGRDQFFEPLSHSASTYLAALAKGLWINRSSPIRYTRDWLRPIVARAIGLFRTK